MFGIRNSLKINIVFFIFFTLVSCKPSLIPEETKKACGYYAYDKNDTLNIFVTKTNKIDTLILPFNKRKFFICESLRKFECGSIMFKDEENNSSSISFENNTFVITIIENYNRNSLWDFKILNYYDNLEIDGTSYDSVYYLADTVNPFSMYSSKNYGFIKIWNDTIVYKFER